MIIVDASIWIDHLRRGSPALVLLLNRAEVLTHPFVIGELALGHVKRRDTILRMLRNLPQAVVGTDNEALDFIDSNKLAGCGIGYVDVHLLVSTRLTPGALLWTRDRQLRAAAESLSLAMAE